MLVKHDWYYPSAIVRGYGHHDLAYLVSGSYPDWASPQEKSFDTLLEILSNEIEIQTNTIISSEVFYLYAIPQDVLRMLEYLGFKRNNIKIILYIRRQDDAHISWYNQRVKAHGYSGTIEDSIQDCHDLWDYQKKINLWQSAFLKENIQIRIYQKDSLKKSDVRNDFLELLGLPDSNFRWSPIKINTRLIRDILEFQRLINKLPISVVEKRRFHKQLMELSNSTVNTELFEDSELLDVDHRKELLKRYANANKSIARAYFNRDQLFDERMPESLGKELDDTHLNIEKLTYILGWLSVKQQ